MNKKVCNKCGEKYGLFVPIENGQLCLDCHPQVFCLSQSPEEIFKKIINMDFPNVRNRKFEDV
jgi:hypothetical protein